MPIPLIENHQNADGLITLPKALRPYMNGRERIPRVTRLPHRNRNWAALSEIRVGNKGPRDGPSLCKLSFLRG